MKFGSQSEMLSNFFFIFSSRALNIFNLSLHANCNSKGFYYKKTLVSTKN